VLLAAADFFHGVHARHDEFDNDDELFRSGPYWVVPSGAPPIMPRCDPFRSIVLALSSSRSWYLSWSLR